MQDVTQLTPEQAKAALMSSFFLLLCVVISIAVIVKAINFINLKLKVLKIKRIAKKHDLSNYTLKTNNKGFPTLLVSKIDPQDIFIV